MSKTKRAMWLEAGHHCPNPNCSTILGVEQEESQTCGTCGWPCVNPPEPEENPQHDIEEEAVA